MKNSQIKAIGRRTAKRNIKASVLMLAFIFFTVAVLSAVSFFADRFFGENLILSVCLLSAVLLVCFFAYSSFFASSRAWFFFYNSKKRAQKTAFWFKPSRVFKNGGICISLFVRKLCWSLALVAPGALVIASAVIIAMNGGVEFNLFMSWIAGGAVMLIAGGVFLFIVLQRYFLVPYIKAESPQLHAREIVKKSKALMNGSMKKTAALKLSFLPGIILCVAVLPVAYFWPYYMQSCAIMAKQIQKKQIVA